MFSVQCQSNSDDVYDRRYRVPILVIMDVKHLLDHSALSQWYKVMAYTIAVRQYRSFKDVHYKHIKHKVWACKNAKTSHNDARGMGGPVV